MSTSKVTRYKEIYNGYEYEYMVEDEFRPRGVPRFLWKSFVLFITRLSDGKNVENNIRLIEGNSEELVIKSTQRVVKNYIDNL